MSYYELSQSIGRLVSFKPYNGGEQYRTDNFAMLPYFLAIAITVASLFLFIGAFFSPKLHRQDDFLWSGLGLFYALVLWICAGRFAGGALLGQIAATLLIIAFIWQTWKLRQAIAFPETEAEAANFSVTQWIGKRFRQSSSQPQPTPAATATETVTKAADSVTTDESLSDDSSTAEKTADATDEMVETSQNTTDESTKSNPSGILKNVFGLGQSQQQASPSSITDAIDQAEMQETEAESKEDWHTDEPEGAVEAPEENDIGEPIETDATDPDETQPTATANPGVISDTEEVTEDSRMDIASASEGEANTSDMEEESQQIQSTETETEPKDNNPQA